MQKTKTRILSIDTSCDETSVAVTENTKVLSNIIWSQASLHAKWGGVLPSLAKREHEERIDWVITKALKTAFPNSPTTIYHLIATNIDAIAVTVGPGLAIALEVGINKAKEVCLKYNLPLIAVNHIEGHLLSSLARPKNFQFPQRQTLVTISNIQLNPNFKIQNSKPTTNYRLLTTDISFPALGVVTSGGHTEVIYINNLGDYQIIATTSDDALGESLDKAARLLGLGYPGGEVLEKLAKDGVPNFYKLPIPMIGREKELNYSYSGLKTAFVRLLNRIGKEDLNEKEVANLAATFQNVAFTHFIRVLEYIIKSNTYPAKNILAGGGVMANATLRKMLRKLSSKYNYKVHFPYSKKLYTDNAAMIGIAAYFKYIKGDYIKLNKLDFVERSPRARVDQLFNWRKE